MRQTGIDVQFASVDGTTVSGGGGTRYKVTMTGPRDQVLSALQQEQRGTLNVEGGTIQARMIHGGAGAPEFSELPPDIQTKFNEFITIFPP